MKIVPMSATLWSITPDALRLIERAGRVCYKSEDRIAEDSADKFVRMLVRRKHLSVLRHASATVHIVGDRGLTHEAVRHGLAHFSQESTRYCNYGNDDGGISVVRPLAIVPGSREDGLWMDAMVACEGAYKALAAGGAPPDVARHVLPISTKAELVVTANLEEWRNIFKARLPRNAHLHIRTVMRMAFAALSRECPPVFEDLEALVSDGGES